MTTASITIRTARPRDFDAVDRLLAKSYPVLLKHDYAPSVLVTAVPLIARAQQRLLASGSYYTVVKEDAIIAAGGWSWNAPQGGIGPRHLGHIRHVAIHPDHARQGIGRALMAHVLDLAFKSGIRRMKCTSTLTAAPFYRALGFKESARVDVMLRPGIAFPAVEMETNL